MSIQNVSVIHEGVETSISDGVLSIVKAHIGTGMPPMTWIRERGVGQHGVTSRGYALEPRPIDLVLFIEGTSDADLTERRRELVGLFHPDFATTLRFVTSNGTRDIDVEFKGAFDLPTEERYVNAQRVNIKLEAPSPWFTNPDGTTLTFGALGGGGGLTFPMTVPFTLGASALGASTSVDNSAPEFWRAEPIVTITGPITDPLVTNDTTGDKLDFTGHTISGGDTYTIDARYGVWSVRNQSGTNVYQYLTKDSDVGNFMLRRGVTQFSVSGSSTSVATSLTIQYNGLMLAL